MEDIKKQQIVNTLRNYCERYESQAKAANSLKNVSAATVSQMLNGKWELIKDDMWRNVAAQIGWKEEKWNAVATRDFTTLTRILSDVQENALVMAVTGDAGSGKTFALKQYTNAHKQVYLMCCNEYWNRKAFLNELMQTMGRDAAGLSVNEMMLEAVRYLKMQEAPLLILDEADKLSDKVLYFFISLYNALEGECGLLMVATSHLELRIRRLQRDLEPRGSQVCHPEGCERSRYHGGVRGKRRDRPHGYRNRDQRLGERPAPCAS